MTSRQMGTTSISAEVGWQSAESQLFWRQMTTDQHVLQIDDNDAELLRTMVTFVHNGLRSDEAVLVISTSARLHQLEEMLRQEGHNIFNLRLQDQYICFEATEMLSELMIQGMPDPLLFKYIIADLIRRAKRGKRKVRAFSELKSLLWKSGNPAAVIALEHLWTSSMDLDSFALLCAYPRGHSSS